MKHVIIMRGVPGSGKSTEAKRWAKLVPGAVIVSADQHMYVGGREFDWRDLQRSHDLCQQDFAEALVNQAPLVIVDNTNTKFSDIVPYVQTADTAGYTFSIMQLHCDPQVGRERSPHPVPREVMDLFIERMWSEHLPSTWDVWTKGTPVRPNRMQRRESEKREPEVLRSSREEPPRHNGPVSLSESGAVVGCVPSGIVPCSRDPNWR